MASYKLFDVHEFYARLPVALCGAFFRSGPYCCCRDHSSARARLCLPHWHCFLSHFFVTVGHVAITDVPLTLFMMLGALSLFSRLHGTHWFSLAVAYSALGLALLIKGPVPVALVCPYSLALPCLDKAKRN